MYGLWLVDMRLGFEVPVSFSDDPWELTFLMDGEEVTPYEDEGFTKNYQKGGPLEWYRAPEFPASAIQRFEGGDGELAHV